MSQRMCLLLVFEAVDWDARIVFCKRSQRYVLRLIFRPLIGGRKEPSCENKPELRSLARYQRECGKDQTLYRVGSS